MNKTLIALAVLFLLAAQIACGRQAGSNQPIDPAAPASSGESESQPDDSSGGDTSPAADTQAPVIEMARVNYETVYYGKASCGATALAVQALISDDVDVATAYVRYRYNGVTGGGVVGEWQTANMTREGGTNQFGTQIDVQSDALKDLRGGDGSLEYQVFARDAAGNESSYPNGSILAVPVLACK
jgi:hypothetical protein